MPGSLSFGCTHVNLRTFFILFKSLAKTTLAPASSTLAKKVQAAETVKVCVVKNQRIEDIAGLRGSLVVQQRPTLLL